MPELAGVFESLPEKPLISEEPQEKKGAEILPFKREVAGTEEKEDTFDAYQALGGHLTAVEYQRIKERAREAGTQMNETFRMNAQSYAKFAGITLSPETLLLYSVLRSDWDISSNLLHSDQPRLAEALRIAGHADDVEKLIAKYPNINF